MQNNITKLPNFTFSQIENIITGQNEKSPASRNMAKTYKKVKDILIEQDRQQSEAPDLDSLVDQYVQKNI